MKDLEHAFVEEKRPPLYTAMKYWGKKPHNIWNEYIKHYTPKGGVFLDPFCGSGLSVLEAIKVGVNAIGFDLNPLSSFQLEVLTSDFNLIYFEKEVNDIINKVKEDKVYKKYFYSKSKYSNNFVEVQHFKWKDEELYELGLFAHIEDQIVEKKYLKIPDKNDTDLIQEFNDIDFIYKYPNEPFPDSPSFSANFIKNIGGNNFSNLWTKRNLYILSLIFEKIKLVKDETLRKQLLFGFIQSLHLCSKMCVPRNEVSNRSFSTSWGRSAYICASRKMEMNPLYVFKSSCLDKQSVKSALKNNKIYLNNKKIKLKKVSYSNKDKNINNNFNLKYGIVDINTIDDFLNEKSVDFIMTDPPYGGLIQYLDLSYLWLSWLKIYDKKFMPNFESEITIKKNKVSKEIYRARFTSALKKLNKILKDEGKIVFTFHNKEIEVWNIFLNSIKEAGFIIEKVIHQQNRRSGESVVANPYGTSGTDFYIRCSKNKFASFKTDKDEFEHIVITSAINIIANRNEPTPYQFLFNGIITEISSKGFDIEDYDHNVEDILKRHLNKVFIIKENTENKAGKNWWFLTPKDYIKYPNRPLSERVEYSILQILRRKHTVTLDDVLAEIFINYPNGLTPDVKNLDFYLKKFATKSNLKWIYNRDKVEAEISQHSKILYYLSEIGKRKKHKIFIGKREQWEKFEKKTLKEFCDIYDVEFLSEDKNLTDRLNMIDMLWFKDKNIEFAFEVENSTNLISAISRGSNLEKNKLKIMVLPDFREKELLNMDPIFKQEFKNYNWKYILYSSVEKLFASKENIEDFLKDING